MTRAEYLSTSLSRRRPWADWSISRATWYRRRSRREQARMKELVESLGPSERRELRRLLDGIDGGAA